MGARQLACVVLAAGKGTRMMSDLPKVLHRIAHRPMVNHVLAAVEPLRPDRLVVVVGPNMESVAAAVAPARTAVQTQQRGTADALKAAQAELNGFAGDVLVLFGDTPLLTTETLSRMVEARRGPDDPAVVVAGMRPIDPGHYGRLILAPDGSLARIVEHADADADERSVGLCNGGIMAFDGARMWSLLDRVGNDNAKGEYYLTDVVGIARADGHRCAVVEADEEEVLGINSRAELAGAEKLMQRRLRLAHMAAGATLVDPDTVHFAYDTRLGRDVVVGPNVVFAPGVEVGDRVEIRPFCHFEGVRIAEGAEVGPFARLRPGTEVGPGVHIGNFVELKNTQVGPGAKINHLSYMGDATIGARANVGAGAITCNYDGFMKYRTEIGAGAFVGTNSSLVAPVRLADGAYVGAGSVVVRDVAADALAVARGQQVEKPGWARAFRERKAAEKAGKANK
ncbi:MAG TPA: bifunctional UDP-N-acetylglucosamine diphosphorylase/glucosamine-1-phosphate N-acetyltransferase GlmU [Azospirillaceae bacterium]|nr:bifunctional UDP-N-acetylglucosamine diphosphorylase/glucosamine-1-phosphate N-acetyltransferase GlmU [Azospirillaceae bacterium]